jgi:hypothetical protein
VLAEEDVGILEALKEDLEASGLGGEGLLLAVKAVSVPERIVERFRGEVDNVGVRYQVGLQLAV